MPVDDKGRSNRNDDQHARFVESAKQLGCDEDEAAFDEKLKQIAKAKPKQPAEKP